MPIYNAKKKKNITLIQAVFVPQGVSFGYPDFSS